MTEATCSLLGWDPTTEIDSNSVGELNANCSAKIMDAEGKMEVLVGERGEIWVQAPKYVSFFHATLSLPKLYLDMDYEFMRG